jgi:putative thioredoxin
MLDITLSNFERDVIEASRQQPVLLDIWAPWCGPCKALGPVLERLETDYAGRFALAKLNSDEQPEIAGQLSQMFGVRSIPFCVLFSNGQPVDGFVGALPESELRRFLDKHVPSATEQAGRQEATLAHELLESGQIDDALSTLRRALESDPGNDAARFDYVRALLHAGRLSEAEAAFSPVSGKGADLGEDLAACAVWIEAARAAATSPGGAALDATVSANARDLDTRFLRAQVALADSRFTDALDELLEILMRDKAWRNGQARKTYIAILRLLRSFERPGSPASPQSQADSSLIAKSESSRGTTSQADAYHRRLSMVLF